MAVTLVDTNVLIDVATEDPDWYDWSAAQLAAVHRAGGVAINAVIYAEFSIHYAAIEDVEAALSGLTPTRLAIPFEAAFLAGKVFQRYRAHGGRRSRPLPDFFIGAHAGVDKLPLLTRDPLRYREYFAGLDLLAPERA